MSPGRTRGGTEGGNIRGCARPPGESSPRLTLAPRLSQGENRGGRALQLHEVSLWRGATGRGAGGKPREERCLLLREGTRRGFPSGRGPRCLPRGGVTPRSPGRREARVPRSRPLSHLCSPGAGGERGKPRAWTGKVEESTGLKALGSQLGRAGKPGFPGVRLPGRPQRGERGRGEESVALLVTEIWGH